MSPRSPSSAPVGPRRRARPAALLALAVAPLGAASAGAQAAGEVAAQEVFDHEHRLWGELLADHVRGARFDYHGLAQERSRLDRYLLDLARVTPAQMESWSEAQRHAFFLNAYNAFVVHRVVDAYPIDSILDLSTDEEEVWAQPTIPLGPHLAPDRDRISLDELEHGILRSRFRDTRVHFATSAASLGGPPRASVPFTAEELSEQLDARTQNFLTDERWNAFDPERGRAELSKLFEWYAEDFERDAGGLRAFLRRHLPGDDDAWLDDATLAYREFDWALDAAPHDEEGAER